MRYRLEVNDDEDIDVHNVETGLVVGWVWPIFDRNPKFADREFVIGCNIYSNHHRNLSSVLHTQVREPLRFAAVLLSLHEEQEGYPTLKAHAAELPQPDRMEHLLGALLADTCKEMARGALECQNVGSLNNSTKLWCAALLAKLHAIWSASKYGSLDHKLRVEENYFSGATPSSPRMSFADAAEYYGMKELRKRFPDLSDTTLQEVLAWPLALLPRLTDRLAPLTPLPLA
jgi:hypothetical protein